MGAFYLRTIMLNKCWLEESDCYFEHEEVLQSWVRRVGGFNTWIGSEWPVLETLAQM